MNLRVIDPTPGGGDMNHPDKLNSALAHHFRGGNENCAVDAVDAILRAAADHRASDVHLEPWQDATVIRFRVDGVMIDVARVPAEHHARIVARVKVLARMVTYHKDLPQDGRIDAAAHPAGTALRVAAIPTVGGEKVVLRALEGGAGLDRIGSLGFREEVRSALSAFVRRPQGTMLLTGPSSSGKTTTIYAMIREILTGRPSPPHVVTVEDPVEYRLDRVDQTEINAAAGLTFQTALRALLRQDPEVIVVGEIRDAETARMAIQAGLTGHLVVSTIHSGSAAGVFTRLLDMGVEPYLVSSSITGVLSQRLVRRLCPECRQVADVTARQRDRFGIAETVTGVHKAVGCDRCLGTGYRGRTALGEWLPVSDAIADAVLEKPRTPVLERLAREAGSHSLRVDGLARVAAGDTTLDELERVLLIGNRD